MDYNLIVLGAGWAGFNAALMAKRFGLKVAILEAESLGGTCLNRGCIPTKALLHSSKLYSSYQKSSEFGIQNSSQPKVDFPAIQQRKNKVVSGLASGMQHLLSGIDFIKGYAELSSETSVKVDGKQLTSNFILIATGAHPSELPSLRFDKNKVLSSDELLNIETIPDKLLIIGGGFIGCEFASLFSAFGSKVEIIEKTPQLIPGEDEEVARKLQNIFKKKGIKVNLSADLSSFDISAYDKILVSVGRSPFIKGLGLEKLGVALNDKKAVVVDIYGKTNIESIYAAGDCTAKIMLAHYAAYQGIIAAENIAASENKKETDNQVVPVCIFTDPEIASVGMREAEARKNGIDIAIYKFDFRGLGMAHIIAETDGFIKIISEAESGYILGAFIIGPRVTELIGLFSLAIRGKLKISQLRDTIFAHPTISECIPEAVHKEYPF